MVSNDLDSDFETQVAEAITDQLHMSKASVFSKLATKACNKAIKVGRQSDIHAGNSKAETLQTILAPVCTNENDTRLLPWHVSFLRMCLEYGYNEPACRMASKRWNALDNTLKSIDVLHFFYYSALVYLKARNYLHARSALVKVLSVPGSAISVVQATALRKLCIVDLIMFGEVRPLPSWLPKSNPLLDRLLDGVRGANRLHDSENDFSPEKSVTRSSRSTTVPSDAFEIANPEVSCPSQLRDVVRVFTDPNASISGLVTCLGKFEQQLRISKDWGLACRLVVAKQSHLLLKISNVFERVPLKYIKENCECSSEKELQDVLDFFNHMSCITGIVVRRKDEELFEFNISTDGTNDQFDSLRREIGYLKSIQTL